ncbi:MAG: DUF2330 domain-containing protein [Candidatus Dormibacteraeota bacterium]|nr:DUF2330 domain-containing protein [Candidatus Dormibacteraeota bacterium]MBV9524551.1 DUF2330 domain-containing protein [Candidatus Dormibacteraeota bacterium]
MRKVLAAAVAAGAALMATMTTALACGGLVAPDGDVRLSKATTFVAWHDGVEHYVTSFAYAGSAADVGWIVPLPAVPSSISAAGRWTLQRLEREFAPPEPLDFAANTAAKAAGGVVVEQVQVEALDVTVLKGSGTQVVDWCIHNGFLLPPEAKDHLLTYAQGSPVFMAAKYNTSAAQQRGLLDGDGVPLLITMRTPQLWVPLEVLANDDSRVVADLFLLTDTQLHTAPPPSVVDGVLRGSSVDGARGFSVAGQERMTSSLHDDLAGDRNMAWVPESGYLTYLALNADSSDVTYDLGVGGDATIRLASFGTAPSRAAGTPGLAGQSNMLVSALALVLVAAGGYAVWRRSRLTMSTGSTSPPTSMPSTREKK